MLPKPLQDKWLWWNLALPPERKNVFADLIEPEPFGVAWNPDGKTQALLASMSVLNREKVKAVQQAKRLRIGALYKRTRGGVVRAEVRFDDIAGCLRTPSGGSSRQTILVVEGDSVRSRLLSAREFMGCVFSQVFAYGQGVPDDEAVVHQHGDFAHRVDRPQDFFEFRTRLERVKTHHHFLKLDARLLEQHPGTHGP